MKLRGKTVIVTGASQGIGRECAREFAKAGSNVVLASRKEDALRGLADELSALPGKRLVVPTDVRDRAAVGVLAERAVKEFGSIDVLVNNAGVGLHAPIVDGSIDNMRYVIDVNLFGVIHAVQAVAPVMREQGAGAIVNVSSVAARIVTPNNGIYSGTKAALNSLTDALRLEMEGTGVRVIAVYPGYTATNFHENVIREGEPVGPSRLLSGAPASAVARKIVRLVRREGRDGYVTRGDAFAVTLKNVSPRLVDWGVKRLWGASRKGR
jgi:short-subunit dehydrogenase